MSNLTFTLALASIAQRLTWHLLEPGFHGGFENATYALSPAVVGLLAPCLLRPPTAAMRIEQDHNSRPPRTGASSPLRGDDVPIWTEFQKKRSQISCNIRIRYQSLTNIHQAAECVKQKQRLMRCPLGSSFPNDDLTNLLLELMRCHFEGCFCFVALVASAAGMRQLLFTVASANTQ